MSQRIPAIDAARGMALCAMAVFHLVWDLAVAGVIPSTVTAHIAFRSFGWTIAGTFLTLVGVSLVLAHGDGVRWRPFLIRLAQVAAAAAGVSLVTYLAIPGEYVFFGILHNIALSSLIALALLRAPWPVAAAAAVVLFVLNGLVVRQAVDWPELNAPWFDWLGLGRYPPRTVDWVPVVPWTGFVLAGMALARAFRPALDTLSTEQGGWTPRGDVGSFLTWAGRHSLAIYLIHQPVLIAGIGVTFWLITALFA